MQQVRRDVASRVPLSDDQVCLHVARSPDDRLINGEIPLGGYLDFELLPPQPFRETLQFRQVTLASRTLHGGDAATRIAEGGRVHHGVDRVKELQLRAERARELRRLLHCRQRSRAWILDGNENSADAAHRWPPKRGDARTW